MAQLEIHARSIYHNTKAIVGLCHTVGVDVIGVTKGVCGLPAVARAMLVGGVAGIADSRLVNLSRLRRSGIGAPMMLLRSPTLGEMARAVGIVDTYLCSDLASIKALSQSATRQGHIAQVIPMVEMGDRREGVMPQDLEALLALIHALPGVRVRGLGTNMACFAGVKPTPRAILELRELGYACGLSRTLPWVLSAGNSSCLGLIIEGKWPDVASPSHVRVGESILLGRDVLTKEPITGLRQDGFGLLAEVIEVAKKPSLPQGVTGYNAFDEKLSLKDYGIHQRAIVALGKQDLGAGHLYPTDPGIEVVGMTSDHTILAVDKASDTVKPGDTLEFRLDYGGLLGAMTSPYVEKIIYE